MLIERLLCAEPAPGTPEQLTGRIRSDLDRMNKLIPGTI
jgi:hypothetical protein